MHHGCDKAWLELQSRLVVAEDGGGGEVGQGPSAESREKERGPGVGAAVAEGERMDV